MEPIKKIVSEADNQDPIQEKIRDELEGSSVVDNQIRLLTPTKNISTLSFTGGNKSNKK